MKRLKKSPRRKRYVVATAVIFDTEGRVLLTKRHAPQAPYVHNKWQFPGGQVEFGEHPYHTLLREIREETGIEIEVLSQEPILHSQMFGENIHVLLLMFPAKHQKGEVDITGDRATSDAKWCHYNEIDFSLCLPAVKTLFNKAMPYYNNSHGRRTY